MAADLYLVDAFTTEPFAGNPAAVCLPDHPLPDPFMQALAREIGWSETAFVVPGDDGAWSLRWFTPAVEVDLCGHATLAAAHVLWEMGRLAPGDDARFDTRSGRLVARRDVGGAIELDFPADPPASVLAPELDRGALVAALRIHDSTIVGLARGRDDLLVELSDATIVRGLVPDPRAVAAMDARVVIVTARADDDAYDIVSRVFGAAIGIGEDPVTGSAHCTLAGYWCPKLRRDELRAWQASARGGEMRVRQAGERVLLTGHAVTVAQGELRAEV